MKTPRISVSVMAHHSRAKYFEYLRSKLGQDVPFAIDPGDRGIWRNCAEAWKLHDPAADYHIVVQDDVIVGRDFLQRAAEYMQDDMVYNFYIGRPRFAAEVNHAMQTGADRLIKQNIHHEMCIAIPTHRIKDMLAYAEALHPVSDKVINSWVRARDLAVCFTMPSLVDHRNEGSLHNENKGRYEAKANWFIGE